MTDFQTGSATHNSFKAKLSRLFRERELILRSEGQVRYLRLKPLPQMIVASAICGTFLWLAGANGYVFVQNRYLDEKQMEILEARVAYEQLRGTLHDYQEQLAELAQGILAQNSSMIPQGAVELQELATVTNGIENAFNQINRDLNLTQADRDRIIQSRNALHTRIAELENALLGAQDTVSNLEERVAARDSILAQERAKIASLTNSREELQEKAGLLDNSLTEANVKINTLETRLQITAAALTEERSRVEGLDDIRARLAQQVETLQSGLSAAEARGERLASNVANLTENLKDLETERVAMAGEREALASDLSVVETELNLHQAATDKTRHRLEVVVARLAELTNDKYVGPAGEGDVSALQALESQIGDLTAELRTARNNAVDMESAIGEVVVGLAQVAGDSPTRLDTLDAPEQKVSLTRELLDEVTSVQQNQAVLISRLTDEAELGISRNEALLQMAGLDVDKLLRSAGFETGMGGPLEVIPETNATLSDHSVQVASADPNGPVSNPGAELADEVDILQSRLARMSALNDLMRCVPLISPVDNYQLTSPFGQRKDPINGKLAMHSGIDIGGWAGIPVHVTAPGKVIFAGRNAGYGYMVEVDHGCGIKTVYAHLKRIKVKVGEVLEHRTVIGTLGSTGRSTGPHVHYEIRVEDTAMDPVGFIEAGRHVHKI
ncbi:MAG: peptidoglycan DD-metalloendopeptidase family protein [Alphaproteobacteria bacterium]|nr:peptidoglycan DD-metalloendopeptidase family protein [Alphaproteobacteria bacterium]